MQDAVRLADLENGAKTMAASEAIGMRLSLGGNKALTIGDKDLVLFGMPPTITIEMLTHAELRICF